MPFWRPETPTRRGPDADTVDPMSPRPPLRKKLGQHHLVDGALCRPAVEFLGASGREVLEIGPGGGVLTAELLAAGARVTAWELDPAWALATARRLRGAPVRWVVGDALEVPWERLPEATLVAGNLPYNVATPILTSLLVRGRKRVPRAAFLVQLEVAERLVADAGDPAYGALSVLVRTYARPRLLGRVKRGSFHPPPKVDGAYVGLVARTPPLPSAELEPFQSLVRRGFGQRRKTLRNSLAAGDKVDRPRARDALAAAGLPPRARAEELALEEWLSLWRAWKRA